MSVLPLIVFGALFATGQSPFQAWVEFSKLATQKHEADDFAAEEQLRREALRLAELKLPPEDSQLAALLANLALCLHSEGRDQAGDPLARRAVALAEQSGDRRLLGAMLNTLGVVLAGQRQMARAEPVLRRSVALLEEADGADALEVAHAAINLATVYADTRQYQLAEREMARVLPVYERKLGPEHPLYAMASNNMFAILYQQNRISEAEPYLRRALSIGEKKFPGTLNMANLKQCLAVLEMSREHFQEAARLLEAVIATEEKLLGPDHPQLAPALENYSIAQRRLHHKSEAKNAHDRASFIQKSFLGDVSGQPR